MSSNPLLPSKSNTSPRNRTAPQSWLTTPVEIDYGQQLSAFTELKEGKKSRNMFSLLATSDEDKREPDSDGPVVR
jgi:hypothetical protein